MIIGFDFDGTLVESWTASPLPGVRERLAALPRDARTFIATNQAGPVFRAVTGQTKYPTCADVAQRIIAGLAALGWRPGALFIALHPGKEPDYTWRLAAQEALPTLYGMLRHVTYVSVSAVANDRKPNPGMLLDAAAHFAGAPPDLCYIGDMDTDRQAAVAAGCSYQEAVTWRR